MARLYIYLLLSTLYLAAPLASQQIGDYELKRGTVEEVREELEKNQDLKIRLRNMDVSLRHPIMLAAASNPSGAVMELLIKEAKHTRFRTRDGVTALMLAAGQPSGLKVVQVLLAAGEDPLALSATGETPLACAAKSSDSAEVVRVLLAARRNTAAPGFDVTNHVPGQRGPKRTKEPISVTEALFLNAAHSQSGSVAGALIEAGADVYSRNAEGQTALMVAAANPNGLEVVKSLVRSEAKLEARTDAGLRPLMFAARSGETAGSLEFLVASGAQIDVADMNGVTALQLAIYSRSIPSVKLLLEAGADIERPIQNGVTPLMIAARLPIGQRYSVLELLIESGAKVDATDEAGMTPLVHALTRVGNRRFTRAITVLLDGGAQFGSFEFLLAVAVLDDCRAIDLFLERGANIDWKAGAGRTALMTAIEYSQSREERLAKVEFLLAAGANVSLRDDARLSALDLACELTTDYRVACVLLKAGAKGKSGALSRLLGAALSDREGISVSQFLSAGATVDLSESGEQLSETLYFSAGGHDSRVVSALLKAGADPNHRMSSGLTALMAAAVSSNDWEVIHALISAGADVEAKDSGERTALMHAARDAKSSQVIHALLNAGAQADLTDRDGWSALDYALKNENLVSTNVIEMLKQRD